MASSDVALFDLDGSLADYDEKLFETMKAIRADEEPPMTDIIQMWIEVRTKPHMKARAELIKSLPGWWEGLPPIPMGMQIFKLAAEMGFSNNVLTRGPRNHSAAWEEKFKWCRQHLGFTPVHITENKSLVYGKFLYDDFPPYCEAWLETRPRGLVILPDRPYNQGFVHERVVRWTGQNLDEVAAAMKKVLDRGPGQPLTL